MIPNIKKDLHTLKTDFDDNGVNRITPKLLRDFLVSVYSSRYPRRIYDSQDIDENDDFILVDMNESGNYIRLPFRLGLDDSGTPFINKKYTICNIGAYPFNVITQTNDLFHNHSQIIKVAVGETFEFVATPDFWVYWNSGSIYPNGGLVGFPVRTLVELDDGLTKTCDRVSVSDALSIKWLVNVRGSNLSRTSEIIVNVKPNGVEYCEISILGDDIDIDFNVVLISGYVELRALNNSSESLTITILRVSLI